MKIVVLLITMLSLGSCASMRAYNNCDVHGASQLPSLYPAEYGVTLLSTQQIKIKTRTDKFEFISLLEIHPAQLSLVALTPLGQTLFQLQYQPQKLDYNGQGVPASFIPEFLLTDISLIYGTDESLRRCFAQAAIPFNISRDNRNIRHIRLANSDDISIHYSNKSVWGSNITYKNHTRNFTIDIQSLGVEYL